MSAAAYTRLHGQLGVIVQHDAPVQRSGEEQETNTKGSLLYPVAATAADRLHEAQVTAPKTECKDGKVTVTSTAQETRLHRGWGVTVAVVDSGFMSMKSVGDWKYQDDVTGTLIAENSGRCIIYRDFLSRSAANDNLKHAEGRYNSSDQNGHGTHVVSTIADNRETVLRVNRNATPTGVAPEVNVLVARVLNKNGVGTYGEVIGAIDWLVQNKARYNVRVLNLSIQSPVAGPYWADPLNQAVMKAWRAGIMVVAAAGNYGAEAGTITVPGNVPYVVTAGAIKSGRYSASGYDELATYSSRGPTESAFVKPDVVVPASRTIAPMPKQSNLGVVVSAGRIQTDDEVNYKIGAPARDRAYYQLSGTSMAAAEVSGLAALVIQKNSRLTPDQVKHRLMSTARPALDAAGQAAYSP